MIQIAPSILSADFSKLGREIDLVATAGAHVIHVDVMDGHFVPNITIGPPVIRSIKRVCRLPLDVHLMISEPDRFIPVFVKSGADRISVHIEACPHIHRTITRIKSAGVKAGVAINPGTPVGHVVEVLPLVDFVLVMTVNPGFGGQKFITSSIDKIKRLQNVLVSRGLKAVISVDGGVNQDNILQLVEAGAKIVVVGNSIFGARNPIKALRELIGAVKQPIESEEVIS